jgi:hypothetical protein
MERKWNALYHRCIKASKGFGNIGNIFLMVTYFGDERKIGFNQSVD